jgi:hypothetical protein
MVVGMRAVVVGAVLLALTACSTAEPSAPALAATAAANLKSARTTHIEGTGSFSIKDALSTSFDFKLSGEAELPDKSRMRMQITTLGGALVLDTISVGGRSYTKDQTSGRWTEGAGGTAIDATAVDLSAIRDVVEVDRPTIDGRRTRHLRYSTDGTKLLEALRLPGATQVPPVTGARGSGELWIRIDDSQIVRQSVTVSFRTDGQPALGFGGSSTALSTTFEMSIDMRFSRHGEPVVTISPPPTR